MSETFLFQAIQFIQTILIQIIQFSISMQLVLFNPLIGPYQVLPFWAKVDLGAMAMKGCSAFTKAPASLEPQHQIISCHIQDTHWWWGLTPLQRCSRCILQPQPTGRWVSEWWSSKYLCNYTSYRTKNMVYLIIRNNIFLTLAVIKNKW